MRIDDYIEAVGSAQPTPGGGSAAALVCALGAALVAKAAAISGLEADAEAARRMARGAYTLMSDDEDAFTTYIAAVRRAAVNPRAEAMIVPALRNCTAVPYKLMGNARSALELAARIRPSCKTTVMSDLDGGTALLKTAAESAWLTIKGNLDIMEEDEFRAEFSQTAPALIETIRGL